MTEFDTFWSQYPRKTGKLDAIKAYERARRLDSAENILAGVERYKRTKPEYADWCHPSTFLNKGRWMDEEDEAPAAKPRWECPHETTCNSKTWCLTLIEREREGWVRDSSGQWRQREAS